MLRQQRRLEWKDAQHMVHTATDLFDALGTPGPDRWRNEVHRLDAFGLQGRFKAKVEIRCIDTDEQIRALAQQANLELLPNANNLPVATQDLPAIAMYRQLMVWPPGLKSATCHLWSANAARIQGRPALTQTVKQQGSQQVTRGFAGDHADLHVNARFRAVATIVPGTKASFGHLPKTQGAAWASLQCVAVPIAVSGLRDRVPCAWP